MWKKLVGEKWAPTVAKFFFSFVSIALGIYVIYHIEQRRNGPIARNAGFLNLMWSYRGSLGRQKSRACTQNRRPTAD
jgi:hypothetical protein